MEIIDIVAGIVLLCCLLLLVVVARRATLHRYGATLDLGVRVPHARHQSWTLGLGRLADDRLQWYRLFSLGLRPRRSLPRTGLAVTDRRRPSSAESLALLADAVVVVCDGDDGVIELAMAEAALPGFLAWLESAPPGSTLPGPAQRGQ